VMREANVALSGLVRELEGLQSDEFPTWRFLCECDDPACREWVEMELEMYEAIRSCKGHVLAVGHSVSKTEATRRAA
jgi:hypothetical protein